MEILPITHVKYYCLAIFDEKKIEVPPSCCEHKVVNVCVLACIDFPSPHNNIKKISICRFFIKFAISLIKDGQIYDINAHTFSVKAHKLFMEVKVHM